MIKCPTLVVGGEKDYLTPPRAARHMAQEIPQATYQEVKKGSHFAIFEQPELINQWILDFTEKVYND